LVGETKEEKMRSRAGESFNYGTSPGSKAAGKEGDLDWG